jgi:hypothetical protein
MHVFERAAPSPWMAARVLGALALIGSGVVHIQQFFSLYSEVPTIGTLFVLNFAGATAIGLGLLLPVERLPRRLLALAGIGLAGTAFVFLLIAEHAPLFGFMEAGYYSTAIVLALVTEGMTVVLLGAFLLSTKPWAMWSTG